MNYTLGRPTEASVRSHMASCKKCQKRLENLESGLVETAEEEALPTAPLTPAIPLMEQKSVEKGKSGPQKQKRPAKAV